MGSFASIQKEDLINCSELYVKVFNAAPWNDQWTMESAFKRLDDMYQSRNFEGLLYIQEGRIKAAIFGNYEHFYDGIHYNLREMFVDNDLQGTGIGSEMLKQLEASLQVVGVTTIILFTSKGNRTSQFYIKNGFSEWTGMAVMGKDI